ncbi:MAG: DUF4388 domain-containing protein [Acidobacteriota bacterium]
MGIFDKTGFLDKVRHAIGISDEARTQQKIDDLEEILTEEPNNLETWELLAQCYELIGQMSELRRCFLKLANLYQIRQQYDIALGYHERAEALFEQPNISLLKQRASLYFACQRLEDAYIAARAVIQFHVNAGERDAALNFLRLLPSFGPNNLQWRRELNALIPNQVGKTGSLLRNSWRSLPRFSPDLLVPTESINTRPGELVIVEPEVELSADIAVNLFSPIATNTPNQASSEVIPEAEVITATAIDLSEHKIMIFGHDNWRSILVSELTPLNCQLIEANTMADAEKQFAVELPTLVLAQRLCDDQTWYLLLTQMQTFSETHDIPFVCLSENLTAREMAEILSVGVTDCWRWPMETLELQARVQHQLRLAQDARNAIIGQLQSISLPDTLQMLEGCRQTGLLILKQGSQYGTIFFNDGRAIDAAYSRWIGEAAFYRLIQWTSGYFRFESQPVEREVQIQDTVQGLLMEAMRRIDEQAKIISILPTTDQILYLTKALPSTTTPLSTSLAKILTLFDGQTPLGDCLPELDMDVETLEMIANLYRRGLLAIVQ